VRFDSTGGMRFHGGVHGALSRLSAALLIGLLAGPAAAPGWLAVTAKPIAPSAHGNGMAATPAPALSVDPAVAAATVAASLASAPQRIPVRFHPRPSGNVTNGGSRLPMPARAAPTILRV
jgi:hypothetical protein